MKIKTLYVNEITGEVFDDKNDCINSEREYAQSLINSLNAMYNEISSYCLKFSCSHCPFLRNEFCQYTLFRNKIAGDVMKENS